MKTAIISGCNRGIGAGIRDVLLSKGFQVVGLNRTPADIDNENYYEVSCDLSNSQSIKNAVKIVLEKFTKVDVLINNAAIRRFENVETLSDEDWLSSINTNLNSVFCLTKAFLPSLKQSKGYNIIVGSHAEKYTFAGGSAYCSTKAALRGFSECLLEEVRHHGVRVSYLSIGAVKNREHGGDESWKLLPEDVGKCVAQLLETDARALASYVDFRPAKPLRESRDGIEKLQYK